MNKKNRSSPKYLETSYLAEVEAIRRGIPAGRFSSLASKIGISKIALARHLDLSISTIDRCRREGLRLSPIASERILRVERVLVLAEKVAHEKAAQWLCTPAPGFRGRAPVRWMTTGLGARVVEGIIAGTPADAWPPKKGAIQAAVNSTAFDVALASVDTPVTPKPTQQQTRIGRQASKLHFTPGSKIAVPRGRVSDEFIRR